MNLDTNRLRELLARLRQSTTLTAIPSKPAAVTAAALIATTALWWLAATPETPAPPTPAPQLAETPPALEPAPLPPPVPNPPPAPVPARPDDSPPPAAPAEPPQQRPQPWVVIDPDRYPLDAGVVDHYTRLPQPYAWPLPDFDSLDLICYDNAENPHLGILATPDGRLFHWGQERRFLTEELERYQIESTELATIAHPGTFLEPLRAAAHAICALNYLERQTEAD